MDTLLPAASMKETNCVFPCATDVNVLLPWLTSRSSCAVYATDVNSGAACMKETSCVFIYARGKTCSRVRQTVFLGWRPSAPRAQDQRGTLPEKRCELVLSCTLNGAGACFAFGGIEDQNMLHFYLFIPSVARKLEIPACMRACRSVLDYLTHGCCYLTCRIKGEPGLTTMTDPLNKSYQLNSWKSTGVNTEQAILSHLAKTVDHRVIVAAVGRGLHL